MTFLDLNFDLNDEDEEPTVEDVIKDFFPEKIGTYNYDIQNKAIICYKDMITRTNRSNTSSAREDSHKGFLTTPEKKSSKSSQQNIMSIANMLIYAADNNLKCIERQTPINERTQEIIIGEYPHRYTIQKTYYLFDAPNKSFYKMYKFYNTDIYALLSIIREVVLHNYAVFLNSKCKSKLFSKNNKTHRPRISKKSLFVKQTFKVKRSRPIKPRYKYLSKIKIPKLENYFLNDTEGERELILKYELLNIVFPTVSGFSSQYTIDFKNTIVTEWEFFFSKVVDLLTCFETNGLFHNDTHRENLCFVRISYQTYSLAIIDFGKATLNKPILSSMNGFIKPKIKSTKKEEKENFLKWINNVRTQDTIYDDNTRYGGLPGKEA